MAHMVAGAPGGARGAVVPVGGQGRGMVMVRSTMETAIERMKKMGEGLAVFPLAHGDDVKECVVGMVSERNESNMRLVKFTGRFWPLNWSSGLCKEKPIAFLKDGANDNNAKAMNE